MGCGSSSPVVESAPKRKAGDAGGRPGGAAAKKAPEHPDRGLSGTHDLVKFLGKGGTGDTFLFVDRATGEEVAIKLVKRPVPKVLQPNLLREIRIQADLGEGHVNIIEAKEALLTDNHLALTMEYAACGSLTSYVADKWPEAQHSGLFCSEDEARFLFRQFISAVEYCHEHFVAHRDLKLDNTLLSADEPPVLKLCDFGFSRHMDPGALMHTHLGTPVYMAPELIHSRTNEAGYDGRQVDVWASGILLIVMLLGTFPYDHVQNPDPNSSAAQEEVWVQQTRQSWDGQTHIRDAVERLSADCRDLLNRIFCTDERRRATVAEIKAHPWFTAPLTGRFEEAAARIAELQAKKDEYTAARKISGGMLKKRNEELQRMLDAASQRPPPGEPPATTPRMRVDLREQLILDNPAAFGGKAAPAVHELELGGISEDAEGELRAQQSSLAALMNGTHGRGAQ